MYINNTTHTPDKKNSYLNKFNQKKLQTTDKENKSQNLSNLSTNKDSSDDCKSYCDSVDHYRHQNHQLKKLKCRILNFPRKSQLESCLIEQKQNLKSVVTKYKGFIDQLVNQKQQITQECDDWKLKYEQQQEIIEQQNVQIMNQSKIIQQNLNTIKEITDQYQQEQIQNELEVQEILRLKDQTIEELNKIVQLQQ